MPRLKNLSALEVAGITRRAEDLVRDLSHLCECTEYKHIDHLPKPIDTALAFAALARGAADAAAKILFAPWAAEQRLEIEQSIKKGQ